MGYKFLKTKPQKYFARCARQDVWSIVDCFLDGVVNLNICFPNIDLENRRILEFLMVSQDVTYIEKAGFFGFLYIGSVGIDGQFSGCL